MRKFGFLTIAAAFFMSGTAVSAAEAEKKQDKGERKVCKPEQDSTSRIPRKICKTKAEWDQGAKSSADTANLDRNR